MKSRKHEEVHRWNRLMLYLDEEDRRTAEGIRLERCRCPSNLRVSPHLAAVHLMDWPRGRRATGAEVDRLCAACIALPLSWAVKPEEHRLGRV